MDTRLMAFPNYGTTCYLNSTLNFLLTCPDLKGYLLAILRQKITPKGTLKNDSSIILSMIEFVTKTNKFYADNKDPNLTPFLDTKEIYRRIIATGVFTHFRQEDTHELCTLFFNCFDESELSKPLNKFLFDKFYFRKDEIVQCTNCAHKNIRSDRMPILLVQFADLPENTPATMSNLIISHFPVNYKLDGYTCDKCKKIDTCVKTEILTHVPDNMIISIVRTDHATAAKITTPIVYEKTITIAGKTFSLQCEIVHHGTSRNRGHYIAVLDQKTVIDDENITEYTNSIEHATQVTMLRWGRCPLP